MAAERIIRHLRHEKIPFQLHPHPRAVSGQEAAHAAHVSGYRFAKTVLVQADGERWMVVLPAAGQLDIERVAAVLGAGKIRLMPEREIEDLFPDSEAGAEPPFGSLYGLKVLLDESLLGFDRLVGRAGSHDETLELATGDFRALEQPKVGRVARLPEAHQVSGPPEAPIPPAA